MTSKTIYRSATEGQYAPSSQISCRVVEFLRKWLIFDYFQYGGRPPPWFWRLRYRESSEWINSSSWKAFAWNWKQRTQKEIPALPDSQINDSKVPATSAMYPVSHWRKYDWLSCTNDNADRWKWYCENLHHDKEGNELNKNMCMLNHCLEWYKWVLTNLNHDRLWFNALIRPSHESPVVYFCCSFSLLQVQGY